MTHITLPWGGESLDLNLPDQWKVSGYLEPALQPGVADVSAEINHGLQYSIGSPRLDDLYRSLKTGGKPVKVVLVIDDGSRPTPVARILPTVLHVLLDAGLNKADLTLIPALGLHRPMTGEELARRSGLSDLDSWNWENPACDDPARLAFLGTTSRGTPVWVNKTVVQADLVVSIGCIEPHLIASFGGGYKNLIPGVAGRATIAHNHSLNCTLQTFNMTGQPADGNPMRLDLEEAGRMLKPLVFIINAVLNSSAEVVRIVTGDPVQAHREGCRVSASMYGLEVSKPVDIVIANSHPMDQDLRQGVKALGNSIRAVRPGGVMITLVKANEGVGVFGLANQKLPFGQKTLKALAPVLIRLVPHLKLKGMGEEDRFFLYSALNAMHRADLLMVAPTISLEVRSHLPFARFVDDIQSAVVQAQRRFPAQAEVLVFPYGGTTYPAFPNEHPASTGR